MTWAPKDDFLRLLTAGFGKREEVPILVLGLYIDESADDTTYLVGGVLATASAWDRMVDEWNRTLELDPVLPYWHQSDVYATPRRPPFDVLSDEDIIRREIRFSRAIRGLNPRIQAVSMKRSEYEREVSRWHKAVSTYLPHWRKRERKKWLRNVSPFAFLHSSWVEALSRNQDAFEEHEKAVVVIEESNNAKSDADTYLFLRSMNSHLVNKGYPDRIHSISHKPGKRAESRQLEAADMASWVVRRRLSGAMPHHLHDLIVTGDYPINYFDLSGAEMRRYLELTALIVELFRLYGYEG